MNLALLNEIKEIVGNEGVLFKKTDLFTYGYDASQGKGFPDLIAIPDRCNQVAEIVKIANRYGIPIIARGAGTGLSGGSVPVSGGIVILMTRMNRILELDQDNMVLVVEPGVVNLDIQNYLTPYGFYYPPDPASQKVSTIGGNLGENASGPHCLKYGGTLHYVTGIEVVLPGGDIVNIGGRNPDPRLGGLVSLLTGSEGTLGIITKIILRIIKQPEATKTILCVFKDIEGAVSAVSSIIAHGIVPAVLEAMDRRVIEAVESSIHAGYPDDAGAILLIEVDGLLDGLDRQVKIIAEICSQSRAYQIKTAISEEEKSKLWEGRRGAFASLAKIRPNILIEDGTVPRSRLPQAMKKIIEIGDKYRLDVGHVFHAGDGNFHPMILFDEKDEEERKRVRRAGEEMLSVCINFGGTISGEHGVGIEKISSMPHQFDHDTLAFFKMIKELFDPQNLSNPGKILPQTDALQNRSAPIPQNIIAPSNSPHSPLNLRGDKRGVADFNLPDAWGKPEMILEPSDTKEVREIISASFHEKIPIRIIGSGSAIPLFEPPDRRYIVLSLARLNGILEYDPADMIVTVKAGIHLASLQTNLQASGQFIPLDPPYCRTIGGIIVSNVYGPWAVSSRTVRNLLLGIKVVIPPGRVITGGGRLVKNVAGYDITRLFVGSYGRLGIVTEATFRVYPVPEASKTIILRSKTIDPILNLAMEISRMDARPGRLVLLNSRSSMSIEGNDPCLLAIGFEGYREEIERGIKDLNSSRKSHKIEEVDFIEDNEGKIWGLMERRSMSPPISLRVRIDPAGSWSVIEKIDNMGSGIGIISYPTLGLIEILIYDIDRPDLHSLLRMILKAVPKKRSTITIDKMPPDLAKSLISNHSEDRGYGIMEGIRGKIDPSRIMNHGIIMGW